MHIPLCLAVFFQVWWLNDWNHKHLHLIQVHNSTIQVWVWINLWVNLDSLQNTSSRRSFHDRVCAHTRVIKTEWSWCCPRGTSGASCISPSLRSLCLFANVGPRTSLRCEFWSRFISVRPWSLVMAYQVLCILIKQRYFSKIPSAKFSSHSWLLWYVISRLQYLDVQKGFMWGFRRNGNRRCIRSDANTSLCIN